ncbi:MAG: endolytic transglycosylase MltG [Chitinophagales bacterium]|nr:endolytic transglycosylase MltG [Chitinophagales bacterium]
MKKIRNMVLAALILLGVLAGYAYWKVMGNNVSKDVVAFELLIPTGADYQYLKQLLKDQEVLKDEWSFDMLAEALDYPNKIKPGRYILNYPMSNKDLLSILRSGRQTPVKIVINKFRTKADLAGYIGKKLEMDSVELTQLLNDEVYLDSMGMKPETAMALFIPNTYEFYWNTSAQKFVGKMASEYQKFWTDTRKQQAIAKGLEPIQVIVLASIVEEESQKKDERPTIAGVYLNRLNKGMLLQADPTVKYAVQDFGLTRINSAHTGFQSPYNTYLNTGLPPGPICTPSINAIESVLNAEKHDYMFFCADITSPGYHAFAKTFEQHLQYARKYWKQQDKAGNHAPTPPSI